jgi:tRNA A-37 threonylcarbamoyl transferase component Bud32
MRSRVLYDHSRRDLISSLIPASDDALRGLPDAEIIKRGKARLVVRIPDPVRPGQVLYVKRYIAKTTTLRRRLGHLLRSRAMHEYRQLRLWHEHGLPVPLALGAADWCAWWGGWSRGFIITCGIADARDLEETGDSGDLSLAQRRQIGRSIARTLARAHAAGLIHDDMKARNVLVSPGSDGKSVHFLDLTNALHTRHTLPWHRVKNLAQLHRSLRLGTCPFRERLRFLAEYGRAAGIDGQALRGIARMVGMLAGKKDLGRMRLLGRLEMRMRCFRIRAKARNARTGTCNRAFARQTT